MYIDGMASYSTLKLTNNSIGFLLGYWYGKQYIDQLANPLFETYSRTEFYVEEPIRQIITSKVYYQKEIFKGIKIGLRFETYYDMINGNLEYNWSILGLFNEKFFLKKF